MKTKDNGDLKVKKYASENAQTLSRIIFLTLLLCAVFALINPNFADKYNLISIGQNLAPYAMLALGVLMPISMGGTDLSVGTVCIGAAVVAGKLYSNGMPLWCVIPVMIVFGAAVGLLNGVLIVKWKLQPFIATLGTMMLVRGVTAIFAVESTILYPTGCWYNYLFSSYNGFPVSFIWIAVAAIIIYFIYRRKKFGRYMVSIGSNEEATKISGVNVDKYKILGYMGSGLMAGVAGIFWTASFATVTTATGNGMELDAIAGAYIGGTSAAGGVANVFGCVIGSVMLVILRSGLNFALAAMNVSINSTYLTYVISGIIIILAVRADTAKHENNRKRKPKSKDTLQKQMKIRNIVSILLVGVLIVCSFNIRSRIFTSETRTLGLVMKTEGNNYWDNLAAGAMAAGKDDGYEVICRGPEGEDPSYLPKQLEIASTLITEDPNGLAIASIAEGFTDTLEEAYDRGVPVVHYDSGIFEADITAAEADGKNPVKCYIKASNYDNSALVAEHAYEAVKEDIAASDEYPVGIIQYENTDTAAERSSGFGERFMELAEADPATAGKCEIITEVKPSANNNAYKEALEYLYEKDVRFVFLPAETVVNQVSDAVDAAGNKYDDLKFAGFDTGDKLKEWIKTDDRMIGTVSQNSYMMGYLTIQALAKIDQGQEIEEEIIVPGEWFDKTNVDDMR